MLHLSKTLSKSCLGQRARCSQGARCSQNARCSQGARARCSQGARCYIKEGNAPPAVHMNIAAPGRFAMRDPSAEGWGAASIDPRNDARPASASPHMRQHGNKLANVAVNYTLRAVPGLQDCLRARPCPSPPEQDWTTIAPPPPQPSPEPQPLELPFARKPKGLAPAIQRSATLTALPLDRRGVC